jgi:hypothetical protein
MPLPPPFYVAALPVTTDPVYLWPDFWRAVRAGSLASTGPIWRTAARASRSVVRMEALADGEVLAREELSVDQASDDRLLDVPDAAEEHSSIVLLDDDQDENENDLARP